MRILNLHEHVDIKGGAEVYISHLQRLFPTYNIQSYWLAINEYSGRYILSDSESGHLKTTDNISEVLNLVHTYIKDFGIDIINIHNIFNWRIVKQCLALRPVFKFSHSPVMVCPGKDKFWRHSQKPCNIRYGAHCFKHIYTEGCANRHPKRVINAWRYVNFEVNVASKMYKKIIVMSDYIKSGLLECGIPRDRIICNPYFTDEIEYRHHDGETIKHLLFVGRLSSSKGPHLALKSFELLLSSHSNLHLDVVGDGEMKAQLEHSAKKAGIYDRVSFHGWLDRENVSRIYKRAYLVLFPSIYPEAFGITGIEAMMNSKPVVGFDVGGVSTWLKDGTTGYLVSNGNVEGMVCRSRQLIEDSVTYNAMAKTANEIALKYFSTNVHMSKLIGLYEDTLPKLSIR